MFVNPLVKIKIHHRYRLRILSTQQFLPLFCISEEHICYKCERVNYKEVLAVEKRVSKGT